MRDSIPDSIPFRAPVNLDAEEAVLAAVLTNPRTFAHVAGLTADDFSNAGNALLWGEIVKAMTSGQTITTMQLLHRLAPDGGENTADLRAYLASLVGRPVLAQHLPDYAHVVVDTAERRRILTACRTLVERACDTQAYATAAEVASLGISDLTQAAKDRGDLEDAGAVATRVLQDLASGPARSHSTGIPKLDRAMAGGLHEGRVYGFLAKQKTGKTTLLATISFNLIAQQQPVPHLYLSLEQKPDALMQMQLARYAGFNAERFLDKRLPDAERLMQRLERARLDFTDRGLYFRSKARMSVDELRAMLARVALSGKVRGVILDYYQLVTGKKRGQSTADHLDDVGQSLAEAAAGYGLWILTAAQVNRDGDIRGGDGLLNACDQAYLIGRTAVDGPDHHSPPPDDAWLEMRATRYTPWRHIGTETSPALIVRKDIGPFFEEPS